MVVFHVVLGSELYHADTICLDIFVTYEAPLLGRDVILSFPLLYSQQPPRTSPEGDVSLDQERVVVEHGFVVLSNVRRLDVVACIMQAPSADAATRTLDLLDDGQHLVPVLLVSGVPYLVHRS